MTNTIHEVGLPPRASFRWDDPNGPLKMVAYSCWPNDQNRRSQYLASAAANAMLDVTQNKAATLPIAETISRQIGISVDDVLEQLTRQTVEHLENDICEPAGGLQRIINTPSFQQLNAEAELCDRDAMLVGEALYWIAVMATHHPHLRPSWNLAQQLLEELHRDKSRELRQNDGATRSNFIELRKKYSAVAPVLCCPVCQRASHGGISG